MKTYLFYTNDLTEDDDGPVGLDWKLHTTPVEAENLDEAIIIFFKDYELETVYDQEPFYFWVKTPEGKELQGGFMTRVSIRYDHASASELIPYKGEEDV